MKFSNYTDKMANSNMAPIKILVQIIQELLNNRRSDI